MDITTELKKICAIQNKTMEDIANELGISLNYLMRLKGGSRGNLNQLNKIYKLIKQEREVPGDFSSWLRLKMLETGTDTKTLSEATNLSVYQIRNARCKTRSISEKAMDKIINYFSQDFSSNLEV